MNAHEFIPISAVQGHLCGVRIDGDYCAMPASANVHMPALPATEDRATAPLNAHEVYLLLDEFEDAQPSDYHIARKRQLAEFLFSRIQPSQKRIEALEAALGRLAVDILQCHNDSALEFVRTLTVTSAPDCTPRATLKGDS